MQPVTICNHLNSLLLESFKYYNHILPNKTTVDARQYKNNILPYFIEFIEDCWIPEKAEKYFRERDEKALEYLSRLLSIEK